MSPKPADDDRRTVQLAALVEPELAERAKSAAAADDRTLSAWVRQAVVEKLEKAK